MRVLFFYPNIGTELRIPLALSILIACVRKAGHQVKLFDTTFYGKFKTDNEAMEKMGTHKHTNLNDLVGETINIDPKIDLNLTIKRYKPDLICTSLVERNFNTARKLLKDVDVPVLVGGIMPTIAPDYVIDEDWVDMICVGEGENTIIDFLEGWSPKTLNIWTKELANSLRPLVNLDEIPQQDWSDFDKRHLLKPFMGKVYRGGAFEFSRGCFKSCTFCVAPKLRKVQEGYGNYHRTKTPSIAIDEIVNKVHEYALEMVCFGDTDFLSGVRKDIMWEFLELYIERVNIPFTIQTGVETLLNEEKLKLLRRAKCCAISVGVETGSEKIRKTVIKKNVPLGLIKKAFELCRKYELRVTANYMVGLPYETEKDVRETIKLNKIINPPSIAVTFFTPFMGTELYDICVREKFYRPFSENVYEYPPLDMPQLRPERIKELVKEFTDEYKTYQEDFNIL